MNKDNEQHDAVNHPRHYTEHPSGIECIQVVEHMGFCLGNAVKYIWREIAKRKAERRQKGAFPNANTSSEVQTKRNKR